MKEIFCSNMLLLPISYFSNIVTKYAYLVMIKSHFFLDISWVPKMEINSFR